MTSRFSTHDALVEVERDGRNGSVAHVRLNRPERHNALVPELWLDLRRIGAELAADDAEASQSTFRWLTEGPFVTIAAVRGFALGAGAQLALACDLRVMAADTELALLETELGLLPDMTGTATLTRIVGYARSLELALTCRRIGAHEAHELGIATSVVEPDDLDAAAAELAGLIASRRPDSIRFTKEAIRAAATGDMDASNSIAVQGGLRLLAGMTKEWAR